MMFRSRYTIHVSKSEFRRARRGNRRPSENGTTLSNECYTPPPLRIARGRAGEGEVDFAPILTYPAGGGRKFNVVPLRLAFMASF